MCSQKLVGREVRLASGAYNPSQKNGMISVRANTARLERNMTRAAKLLLLTAKGVLVVVLLSIAASSGFARDKYETIQAQAYGTSTQLGQNIGITVTIYEFSTPENRQALVEAFTKGQNQGLVNALSKMPAVGRIAITGTLGYDLSFIREIPTPTGRKIRFVTNRQIRFGEAWADTQSQAYNLTAGEFDLNSTDKGKSTGILYPAAQLIIDKEGQLQFELRQNPWRLNGIIDWSGTKGEN
jgi:hypothetical protein